MAPHFAGASSDCPRQSAQPKGCLTYKWSTSLGQRFGEMLRMGWADHDRSVPRQSCGGLSRGGRVRLRTQTANDREWRLPWRGRTREARGRPSVAARCTRGYRWCLSAWGHWERGGASSCRWAVIAPPPASPDGGSRCARAWPPRNGQRARRPGHQTASAAGTPPAALGPAGLAGASGAAAQGPALAGDAARSSRGGRAAHHTQRTVRPGRSGPPHARCPWGSRVSFGLGSWWSATASRWRGLLSLAPHESSRRTERGTGHSGGRRPPRRPRYSDAGEPARPQPSTACGAACPPHARGREPRQGGATNWRGWCAGLRRPPGQRGGGAQAALVAWAEAGATHTHRPGVWANAVP